MADSSQSPAPSTSLSAMAALSDKEREEMLERMLTNLAFCDDSKLQSLLANLLPRAIACLSSQSTAIRNKVLEILSHVNKRVKHEAGIGLPLSELWSMYSEATTAPMVRNFCIIYIEMAFERSQIEVQKSMAPNLLVNISKLPPQHQAIILRVVVKVIGEAHSVKIDEEIAAKFSMTRGSQDSEMFVDFCLHTVLYQPTSQSGGCPAGLSISMAERVTGKQPLKNEILLSRKLGILNVIESMDLPADTVYPIYLAASADSQEPIAKRGEVLLKKKGSMADLDNPTLIRKLFLLFNGNAATETIAPENKVSPAYYPLKTRLMSVFCRSIAAANSFPATLQCIFACIYGNDTTPRLKQSGMEFAFWVLKHARMDQLKLMGPLILTGILKSLDGTNNREADSISRETRTFAYQAIGMLAQRMPQLFRDKIDMAVRLFDALKSESQFLRLVIQEATSSLASAYKGASSSILKDLEQLLLDNSQVDKSEVRFCAVRWATSLFDLEHCPSRFLCMVAAADPKMDIREMTTQGLFPDEGRSISQKIDLKYPRVRDMLDCIIRHQPKVLEVAEIEMRERLLFPSKTYDAMIKFLLKCFESDMLQVDSKTAEFQTTVEALCSLIEHAMAVEGSAELHANASKALIEIAAYFPEVLALRYASKINWLKQLLGHVDFDTRESAARLLGIASSACPVAVSSSLISELTAVINPTSGPHKTRFEMQHGALCAIGFVTADCLSRAPEVCEVPEAVLLDTVKSLVDVVNFETATVASIAMQALGHIALRVALPSLVNDSGPASVLTVLREKLGKLLAGDDTKAIKKIAISLGHMCMKEVSPSSYNVALELIFGLCRSKAEDVLFAAGEALAFSWGAVPVDADVILKTNYTSLSTTSNFLLEDVSSSWLTKNYNDENESNKDARDMARDLITKKIFDTLLYSSRKEERCAGTVWLLSLTMYCGRHHTVQKLLPDIQEAFSHLLGEQNELVQELASQGMSLVYELGDDLMKKSLVNALVGTLTGSGKRKRAVKLVEDSEVFQEGTIGDSPSGGKLSTYKELCNMANEMGQPDLIYKFMDLANYQAALNSKRGAAFGFSRIAKHAGDALQPHLRLLIPRLVRYQYDPDKNVQDSMAHIWKSLVVDSKKTIDEHFDLILDDLLTQCGSRLWRSRESSCLALADIIQGRRFDYVGKHLKKLWMAAFRAMDDIKETVRNSGDKLCRAVSSLTIRLCDVSLTDKSETSQAMDIVLPLLLAEGIMSKVDSIRKASIGMVMKLAKGAGIAIRPHLADLVTCMLESLSSLEDQGLNYVELHAASIGLQKDKLENLRISIAKGSAMWETLELCIDVVDEPSLDLLVPRLAQLVRSGVGLNTRVGVASFITLLVQRVNLEIKPFTGTLLRLLFPAVIEERSASAKRAFASAFAIALKYSTPTQAQQFIEEVAALHAGDRNAQVSCAVLLKSCASLAADVLSGYHVTILPVIFISRFEDDKHVSCLFDEVWEENTSGDNVTLQLYLGEIVSLITDSITSSSWNSKRKAAQAITKLSETLHESLSSHCQVLLSSLLKEIPGRLWEGKDALLNALAALCTSCHNVISSANPSAANDVLSVVTTACTKKQKKFQEAALCALDQVIKAFDCPEFFNAVFPLLCEMFDPATGDKCTQEPSGSTSLKSGSDKEEDSYVPRSIILDCTTSCISVAPINDVLQQKHNLMLLFSHALSPAFPWTVKVSAFITIKKLCSKLKATVCGSTLEDPLLAGAVALINELFISVSGKIVDCISTVKIGQVHVAAAECLLEVIEVYGAIQPASAVDEGFKENLAQLYENEKNELAKSLLKNCIVHLENL
ncbi:proteasome-associated protein ECM29 homolog isoform X2 [Chenopodium quinoa]|uniref:proteasome-associated protein ECM29 homolog isoform X2 n=1 Tax=Chenopodium quinoa TaxID=63459 RepID=UPI000B783151|nr:proteasome-associated protein ECM29 homolog isoform X2 [Chenopodium quinoa]